MTTKRVSVSICSLLMALMLLGMAPAAQAANPAQIPVAFTSGAGSFTGVYEVQRFAVRNGALTAVGSLSGTVKNAAGAIVGTVSLNNLALPVQTVQGSCQILHLELGPLDLNLLGLQVHLDRIVLDITAQSGPGNLLGNLLCDIANLLNRGTTPLSQLADLLNQVLSLL
jgi:hypothetical protein